MGRKVRKEIVIPGENFHISSRNYQRLIAKISGKPEERILSYLMLRSLKQARYSNINEGHFALAAPPTRTSLRRFAAIRIWSCIAFFRIIWIRSRCC